MSRLRQGFGIALVLATVLLLHGRGAAVHADGPPAPLSTANGVKVFDTQSLLKIPGMTKTLVGTKKMAIPQPSSGASADLGTRYQSGSVLYILAEIYNVTYYGAVFCSYGEGWTWGSPLSAYFSESGVLSYGGYQYVAPYTQSYGGYATSTTSCIRAPYGSLLIMSTYGTGYWPPYVYLSGSDAFYTYQY